MVALPHSRSRYFETITNTIGAVFYAKFAADADLIHLHGIGPALTAPLAKAFGMKVISTYHSKNYKQAKWNVVGRAALRMGEVCAILFSDHIIVISPSIAERLREGFPRSVPKIRFIPNGADHLLDRKNVESAPAAELLKFHGLRRTTRPRSSWTTRKADKLLTGEYRKGFEIPSSFPTSNTHDQARK